MPCSISGKYTLPDTTGAVPGYVQFILENTGGNQPQVSGAAISPKQTFTFNADGTWSGTIYRNDEISVNGAFSTWWHVTYFVSGLQVGNAQDYYISAASATIGGTGGLTPITTFPAPAPPSQPLVGAASKLFSFPLAATIWTGVHSMGTQAVQAIFYDSNWNEILPDTAVSTDVNTFTATFLEPQAGFMVVVNVGNWTPSVANPNNIIGNPTSSQSIAGDFPLTIGGSVAAKRIENVRYADQFASIQAAINDLGAAGKVIIPAGTYTISSALTAAYPVVLEGVGPATVLKSDGQVINISGSTANGTVIRNLDLQPVSTFTILAAASFPTAAFPVCVDRFGDGIGYQPTVNDTDIYPAKLTTQQQNQTIGPTIFLTGVDSVLIEGITGSRATIELDNTNKSTIRNCNISGGKYSAFGSIVIVGNGISTATMYGNKIYGNTVRDGSFCGIFIGNTLGAEVFGNHSIYNGESGIKTAQPSSLYPNLNFNIHGNYSNHNFYDGLDISADFPHLGTAQVSGSVMNNVSTFNAQTGIYIDGIGLKVIGNTFENNGTYGVGWDCNNSVLSGNYVRNNNTSNAASTHEIVIGVGVSSTNNLIYGNRITHTNGMSGEALFGGFLNNTFIGNIADGAIIAFVGGGHPVVSIANADSTGALPNYFNFELTSTGSTGGLAVDDRTNGSAHTWAWYANLNTLRAFSQGANADRFTLDEVGSGVFSGTVTATKAILGGGTQLSRYARYSLTLSPAAVAANTTAEQSFATSVTSGDVIIGVSKPTTQAGLGIVGHRASGTTLFITFSNNTASPITPTASEVYQVVAVQ